MNFISTRDLNESCKSSEAIIRGISKTGGLYVPCEFPDLKDKLNYFKTLNYQDLAFEIISVFFDDINNDDIKSALKIAYDDRFKVLVNNGFLELYHGPTCAFKDAALLFLPQIMKIAKKNLNITDDIVILTATSGDTGKAALEGFGSIDGIEILVLYPKQGVSRIQELQMITHTSKNSRVISINGNFDDAQSAVKDIFMNENIKEEMDLKKLRFSSANSINIGRLIPQIVYYFYGYCDLLNKGEIEIMEKINVVVPTGNFGNILAAYYAKRMGLPINNFICASNENNVLTEFINTGIYDRRRNLVITESPSMDILVSSNLERLLFELSGRDDKIVKSLMKCLQNDGYYKINEQMKATLNDFYGYCTNTEMIYSDIKEVFIKENYLMDTHTAVAYNAYEQYKKETKDSKKALIVSTASAFKFAKSIAEALDIYEDVDDFEILNILEKYTGISIPSNLKYLDKKEIIHNINCNKENIKAEILSIIKEF